MGNPLNSSPVWSFSYPCARCELLALQACLSRRCGQTSDFPGTQPQLGALTHAQTTIWLARLVVGGGTVTLAKLSSMMRKVLSATWAGFRGWHDQARWQCAWANCWPPRSIDGRRCPDLHGLTDHHRAHSRLHPAASSTALAPGKPHPSFGFWHRVRAPLHALAPRARPPRAAHPGSAARPSRPRATP